MDVQAIEKMPEPAAQAAVRMPDEATRRWLLELDPAVLEAFEQAVERAGRSES